MARLTGNDRDWPAILEAAKAAKWSVTKLAAMESVSRSTVNWACVRYGVELRDGRAENGQNKKRKTT